MLGPGDVSFDSPHQGCVIRMQWKTFKNVLQQKMIMSVQVVPPLFHLFSSARCPMNMTLAVSTIKTKAVTAAIKDISEYLLLLTKTSNAGHRANAN